MIHWKLAGLFVSAGFLVLPLTTHAQIGSEAQGGKLATWAAIGFDQELGKRWISVTNFGYGRHSGNADNHLVQYQGLKVFTQEVVYKRNNHWKFSAGVGYSNRNYYQKDLPAYRNELRPYLRGYYTHYLGRVELIHQVRTDFRWFYTPHYLEPWPSPPFEFRARYQLQVRLPVDRQKHNFLIVSDELLAIADERQPTERSGGLPVFKPFQLTENRLTGYYRHHVGGALPLDIDLGLLYQTYQSSGATNTTVSLMADLILRNPFQRRGQRNEGQINPYLK